METRSPEVLEYHRTIRTLLGTMLGRSAATDDITMLEAIVRSAIAIAASGAPLTSKDLYALADQMVREIPRIKAAVVTMQATMLKPDPEADTEKITKGEFIGEDESAEDQLKLQQELSNIHAELVRATVGVTFMRPDIDRRKDWPTWQDRLWSLMDLKDAYKELCDALTKATSELITAAPMDRLRLLVRKASIGPHKELDAYNEMKVELREIHDWLMKATSGMDAATSRRERMRFLVDRYEEICAVVIEKVSEFGCYDSKRTGREHLNTVLAYAAAGKFHEEEDKKTEATTRIIPADSGVPHHCGFMSSEGTKGIEACIEDDNGRLRAVHDGSDSFVDYCPFCGVKARTPATAGG